jgi:hypothetical protein
MNPQPYHFLDIHQGPYNEYGVGEDTYTTTFDLPQGFELLEFSLYYGYYGKELVINGHVLEQAEIHRSFPVRTGTFVNIAEVARYMPVNNNASAVSGFFRTGENTISMTISAEKGWEERPYDLFARFRVPLPLVSTLAAMLGFIGWLIGRREELPDR